MAVIDRRIGLLFLAFVALLAVAAVFSAAETALTGASRGRMHQLERDGDKAAAWLKTPNRVLRGGRPLDQMDTDPGVREVEDILGRIAYGVYS